MSEQKQTEGGLLARFASPIIILATIIWGSSFVVMKSSVDVQIGRASCRERV